MPPQPRDVKAAQPRSAPSGTSKPGAEPDYQALADAATGQAAADLAAQLSITCDRNRERQRQETAAAATQVAEAARKAAVSASAAALSASNVTLSATAEEEVTGTRAPNVRSADRVTSRRLTRSIGSATERARAATLTAAAAAVAARLAELTVNDHELTLDLKTRGSNAPCRNLL